MAFPYWAFAVTWLGAIVFFYALDWTWVRGLHRKAKRRSYAEAKDRLDAKAKKRSDAEAKALPNADAEAKKARDRREIDWQIHANKLVDGALAQIDANSAAMQRALRNHVILILIAMAAMFPSDKDPLSVLGTHVPQWVGLLAVAIGLLFGWLRLGYMFIDLVNIRGRADAVLVRLEDKLDIVKGDDASRQDALLPSEPSPAWFAVSLGEGKERSKPFATIMVGVHCLLFGFAHACTLLASVILIGRLHPPGSAEIWAVVIAVLVGLAYLATHVTFRITAVVHSHVPHLGVLLLATWFTYWLGCEVESHEPDAKEKPVQEAPEEPTAPAEPSPAR